MIIIKLIVALIWSVVGLVIWIPILFRIMIVYIFNICFITIMEKNIEEKKHLNLLVATGSIYGSGFKNIFKKDDGKIKSSQGQKHKREIGLELLWSILFWGTIIIPFLI
jgi:hypothetical protein